MGDGGAGKASAGGLPAADGRGQAGALLAAVAAAGASGTGAGGKRRDRRTKRASAEQVGARAAGSWVLRHS
jgi:hypothetical protein